MLFFADFCEVSSIVKIIYFAKELVKIVFIVVPIGLIVMVSVDLAKNVIAGRIDDMSKNVRVALKRVFMAAMVFLIPTIVNIMINVLGNNGVDFLSCYANASLQLAADLESSEMVGRKSATYNGKTVADISRSSTTISSSTTTSSTGKGLGKAKKITIKYNVYDDKGRCGASKCASVATVEYARGTVEFYMGRQAQKGVESDKSCRINAFMCATNAVTNGYNSAYDLYEYLLSQGFKKGTGDANLASKSIGIAVEHYGLSNLAKVYQTDDISKEEATKLMKQALDNGQPVMIFVAHDLCSDLAGSHHALLVLGYDDDNTVIFQDSGNRLINAKKRTVEEMGKCITDIRGYYRMIIFSFR